MLDSISNIDSISKVIETYNSSVQEINTSFWDGDLSRCLLFTIALNILCLIIQYYFNYRLKKVEFKNFRKGKILDIGLKFELELYQRLNKLSDFDSFKKHELLDEIILLRKYLDENKIFLTNKQHEKVNEILDYFNKLCANYKEKDYNKEQKLLTEYIKIFNE